MAKNSFGNVSAVSTIKNTLKSSQNLRMKTGMKKLC